jgi:hypothetical protein
MAVDAAPDWTTISEQIECPLCGYNLRGIAEPRCPECGYKFTWRELLSPENRAHSPFFEHQAHRRWRAFWRTAIAGIFPGRFWRDATPAQPGFPGRLFVYFLASALVAIAGEAALLTYVGWRVWMGWGFTLNAFMKVGGIFIPCAMVTVLWPLAAYGGLSVFQISMFRAKIHQIHVARCVIYSADGLVWVGLSLFAAAIACFAMAFFNRPPSEDTALLLLWLLAVWVAVFSYRLWRAYRLYLRFDHSAATVLCAQIIAALSLPALAAICGYIIEFFE